ncbi:MAG: flagellar M-ring protein FliF [Nitrospiraceae bacterium]|nr:MAG: flagellar M-ring protein FliF [Nitrospiraceae bacterium]
MAAGDNILDAIGAWPASKKTAILAVLIVTIAIAVLLFAWFQKADYQVLYSNLSEEDAGRIVEELRSKKVPYELSPGGTVMVSAEKVYDLRLEMASQGLPQGSGVGFEIFDNTSFTTSEFVQKLNFKRAMEGELSRTIRSLSGIEQCRVHLVIPDKSVFAFQDNKSTATAAVFVSLNKGRKLSASEVDGIVHLVSSSVEDLGPANITVVDDRGELLTRPADDSAMSLSGSQMEYQQSYEQNLMTKIVGILEPVVGRGKVRARISSTFDFTRSERTEETFDPEGVVVRSEQKSTEKTMSGSGSSGVPGTASNLPGGGGAQYSPSQGQSQKQDEMINYETSKTITRVVESPVTLERLTVAILIDGILPSQKASIENAEQYTVRTEDDMKYYEEIVKKTIGFTDDRGDEITVNVMPFEQVQVPEMAEAKMDYMPIVLTTMKYVVPIIIFLVIYMVVLKPLLRAVTTALPQRSAPVAGASAVTGEQPLTELPLQPKEAPVEKQVAEWANGNPREAATLVKSWLEEK